MQEQVQTLKVEELYTGPKEDHMAQSRIPSSSITLSGPILKLTVELFYGIEVTMH